jgi:amino acid transporter
MASTSATTAIPERPGGLRRELRFWEAIALSLGIMAPTAAMALNGVAPAGLIGRAVPLAFLFAAIAIALVSYASSASLVISVTPVPHMPSRA